MKDTDKLIEVAMDDMERVSEPVLDTLWYVNPEELRTRLRSLVTEAERIGEARGREDAAQVIHDYFDGLIMVPDPELTREALLAAIRALTNEQKNV